MKLQNVNKIEGTADKKGLKTLRVNRAQLYEYVIYHFSQLQAGKGKKKSTKAKIMAVRDDDYAKDFGDDIGGDYDDFI